MTINQSARLVRFMVAGVDFSAAFASYEGQDNILDQSGLIKHTGKINLVEVPLTAIASRQVSYEAEQEDGSYSLTPIETAGIPEPLDDRLNYCRWQVGTPVTIDVMREDGRFSRHPRGALRVISTTYTDEEGKRSLEVEVGCLLTLLDFKQPTNPDVAKIAIGSSNSATAIAQRLLSHAKITSFGSVSIPLSINYDLEMSGGYVSTVGSLCYSSRVVGYIDRWERFQTKAIDLTPETTYTLAIGQDELAYKRLTGMELPKEIIKVTGTGKLARPCQPPADGQLHCNPSQEEYGPASIVDPNESSARTVVISRVTECESWNPNSAVSTRITTTERPIGLALPTFDYPFKFGMLVSDRETERRYYEQDKKGKLLKVETEIEQLAGVPLAEYFETVTSGAALDPSDLILSEVTTITYEYDCKERTERIVTEKQETIGAIIEGTGEDYSTIALVPFSRRPSERTTETWELKNKGDWQYRKDFLQSFARAYRDSVQPEDSIERKLSLVSPKSPEIERSNSGQVTPPAPEHKPADEILEDVHVEGEARFLPLCPPSSLTDLKERSRSYDIPYLPGLAGDPGDQCGRDDKSAASVYCDALARLEGALLLGRHKGQEIRLPLYDWLCDAWEPLLGLVAIELNGSERVYLLDNSQWILEQQQALCAFDGIWVGDRVDNGLGGYSVLPPYSVPEVTESALVLAVRSQVLPYSLNQVELTQSAIALASRSFGGSVVFENTRSAIALASRSISGNLLFNNTRASIALASRSADFLSVNATKCAIALASGSNAFTTGDSAIDPIEVQFLGQNFQSDGIDPLEGEIFN